MGIAATAKNPSKLFSQPKPSTLSSLSPASGSRALPRERRNVLAGSQRARCVGAQEGVDEVKYQELQWANDRALEVLRRGGGGRSVQSRASNALVANPPPPCHAPDDSPCAEERPGRMYLVQKRT